MTPLDEDDPDPEETAEAQALLNEVDAVVAGHPPELVVAALCGNLIGTVIKLDDLAEAEWQIANLAEVALQAVREHWHLVVAAKAGGAN